MKKLYVFTRSRYLGQRVTIVEMFAGRPPSAIVELVDRPGVLLATSMSNVEPAK